MKNIRGIEKNIGKKVGRKIDVNKITGGLLEKTVDLALFSLFYGLEFATAGKSNYGLAGGRAQADLEEFDSASLKRAIYNLKRKGLVQTVREGTLLPFITDTGKKKLENIIPMYDSKRIWDGRIYLVTYDLPRPENVKRNALRRYLKKIGCGRLQESVWITPYNPKELIEEFTHDQGVEKGMIIVSSVGKDGTIGGGDLSEIIQRVYKLDEVNFEYRKFLVKAKREETKREELIFSYLAILKDDPQLPFSLLPDDWVGKEAYRVYCRLVKKCKP